MLKALLSTVALAALTGSALAGDLPSRKDVPVYVPAPFSWTGFYAGIEGGAYMPDIRGNGYSSWSTLGAFGGLVGYNLQVSPSFVIGIEGDGGAIFGSAHSIANNWSPWYSTTQTSANYFGDIRGRLGWAMDRALLYVAGGVAFGDAQTNYILPWNGATPNTNINNGRTGWTIGAGLDYAVWDNWVVRAEYRYTDLGTETYNTPYVYDRVKSEASSVIFGVIYKFGAPAPVPVVAKY